MGEEVQSMFGNSDEKNIRGKVEEYYIMKNFIYIS
jgi:hypothetical protein